MRPTPSIPRLFAATFIAVALVGLVTQVATWRSARATQMDMVELAQRLDRIQRLSHYALITAKDTTAAEQAAHAGNEAADARRATSGVFAVIVAALRHGL